MISVIVPYKNAEGWLGRCIESLKAQERNAEFILVNDSSTDDSKGIAEDLTAADKRFVLYDNERKPGPSGARNTGLDHISGDWITFVDSDDTMEPGAIEIFENLIAEVPANIYMTNHHRYYDSVDKLALKYTNAGGWYNLGNLPTMWCMVWNKLYSRQLIEGHNIHFKESIRYGEDEIFNLECLAADNRIYHAAKHVTTLTRHFNNKHSLCHSKTEEDLFKQAQALMDFITRQTDPLARKTACLILSEHWSSKTYLSVILDEAAPSSGRETLST
jgi:glycosyltransferase involved in cell wall biosynthesis